MNDSILSVSEVTRVIKQNLEGSPDLSGIWIVGEISNLTYHSSGHIYLTLKDNTAVISGVFFKYANRSLSFKLEEGMSIMAQGGVSVFEKRGSYQFIITSVRLEGIGELQKRIEQLKNKLLKEGIFAPEHKKKLPFLPRRLGVVTSPTGAALRDIIKVAIRRYPNIEIVVAPAKVQGDDAAESIVRGIEALNRPEFEIDVIIAGRGGGSFEDLMPFNEESVVRAFYNSRVPIISAVGHQVDHPLSDDAADFAATTPSAAAEICVPVKNDILDFIDYLQGRSHSALNSKIREYRSQINGIQNRKIFRQPMEILHSRELSVTDSEKRMISGIRHVLFEARNRLSTVSDIHSLVRKVIMEKRHRYNLALQGIEKLSPLSVLRRGYAIVKDREDRVIKEVDQVIPEQAIDVFLLDGSLSCMVTSKNKGEYRGKKR